METEGDTSSAPGVALRGVRENTAGVDIVCPALSWPVPGLLLFKGLSAQRGGAERDPPGTC